MSSEGANTTTIPGADLLQHLFGNYLENYLGAVLWDSRGVPQELLLNMLLKATIARTSHANSSLS